MEFRDRIFREINRRKRFPPKLRQKVFFSDGKIPEITRDIHPSLFSYVIREILYIMLWFNLVFVYNLDRFSLRNTQIPFLTLSF